jgi:hypothetical protein
MKKRYLPAIISLLLLLGISAGCQKIDQFILTIGGGVSTPEYAPTPVKIYTTPLPAFEPFQFAWFYKPPQRESDLGAIASNFSMLILTRNDEKERENLRDMGSSASVLQYLRLEAVMDPGNCAEKPFQNQVAHLEGDYCIIENQHPDWFLRDINGRVIRYDQSQYVFMDPANTEWQAYFLEKVRGFQKDEGWSGVFLDNVDGGLGRFDNMQVLLANYSDDTSYQQAIKGFLHYLYTNYFTPSGKLLYANIPYLEDQDVWLSYLENLDGAMLEAFAVDWDYGYLGTSDWLNQLELAEKTQAQGKRIILVAQGDINNEQRMQFGLASFLLANNGLAYFRYSNDTAYRDLWWYSLYDTNLGQPIGPRYLEGKQWVRNFQNGYVMVNPVDHTSEIHIN